MAASMALPPLASIATPASTASGFAAATMSRWLYWVVLGVQPEGNTGAASDAVDARTAVDVCAGAGGVERHAASESPRNSDSNGVRMRGMVVLR
jgi:hypothetical protein